MLRPYIDQGRESYRRGTSSASTIVVTMLVTPTTPSTGVHDLRLSISVRPPYEGPLDHGPDLCGLQTDPERPARRNDQDDEPGAHQGCVHQPREVGPAHVALPRVHPYGYAHGHEHRQVGVPDDHGVGRQS